MTSSGTWRWGNQGSATLTLAAGAAFLAAVRGHAAYPVTGADGLRVVRDLGDRDRVVAGVKNPLGKFLGNR